MCESECDDGVGSDRNGSGNDGVVGEEENGGTSRSVDTHRSESYPVLSQLLVSHYSTAPSIVEGSQ